MKLIRALIGRRGFLAAVLGALASLLLRGSLRPPRTRPPGGPDGRAREALFYQREDHS